MRTRPARGAATGGKGGGIKTGLQAFLQAFPNLSLFSPSFSKQSFGGFVGFQGVTRPPDQKAPLPNFFAAPPPCCHIPDAVEPHCAAVEGGRRFAWVRATRSVFMAEKRS